MKWRTTITIKIEITQHPFDKRLGMVNGREQIIPVDIPQNGPVFFESFVK